MASQRASLEAVLSHSELGWTVCDQEAMTKKNWHHCQVQRVAELKTVLADVDELNGSLHQLGHKGIFYDPADFALCG
eukprot:1440481-Amphidinium_carterae.1